MTTEPTMRETFVTWDNLFDTAEYVANNLNVTYPSDCEDRVKYIIKRMIMFIDLLSREQSPRPIGEFGYIAIPEVKLDNTLKIRFYAIVSASSDNSQEMKYRGNNTFEVQL